MCCKQHVNVSMSHVTIVEPLLDHYMKIPGCPYSTGQLVLNDRAYPTTLSNATVEAFGAALQYGRQYDTVIVMNVLVYASDAFRFLETLLNVLKPHGLLIFHDRYFLDIVRSSTCKMVDFARNVSERHSCRIPWFIDRAAVVYACVATAHPSSLHHTLPLLPSPAQSQAQSQIFLLLLTDILLYIVCSETSLRKPGRPSFEGSSRPFFDLCHKRALFQRRANERASDAQQRMVPLVGR